MKTIFTVVAEEVNRTDDPARRARGNRILVDAYRKGEEIKMMREERERIRNECRRDGGLNGTTPTGELHMVEYEACRFLCPDLEQGGGKAKKIGWQWVLAQPWGQEFKCAPIEKRFY